MPGAKPKNSERRPYSSPRQEARQLRILQVAREEIAAVGYDAITMQRLAEAADVSTKTLYNLYGSKDELMLAALQDLLGDLQQQADAAGAREGVEALVVLAEVSARQVVKTPRYSEVLARALFQADKDHRLTKVLLGGAHWHAEKAFSISLQQGEMDADTDIQALAKILAAHQWGLIIAWSKGLVSSGEFSQLAMRSLFMTVFPASRGKLKKWLKQKALACDIDV